jgi:hypothetical protein
MVKLNIGAGQTAPLLDGYIPIDRKDGQEAYPLTGWQDESVDEIYASHVLEHFSAKDTPAVVNEWARVLKPGGRMRIAVPDFRWCAARYMSGEMDGNLGNYICGAQSDQDDYHKSIFDEPGLRMHMERAGLVGIERFAPFVKDCSSLPVSLNLEGYKPANLGPISQRCILVCTMPRLNWTYNREQTSKVCYELGIPYFTVGGAYFDQSMERALEEGLKSGREYIITLDYDSVFTPDDVRRLVVLMDRHPNASAIAALQAKRGGENAVLLGTEKEVTIGEIERDVVEVKSAHFGLTIIRAECLKHAARPWLHHQPAPDGTWGDGHIDADVAFWTKLGAVAPVYVSPRVSIGHLQVMVSWVNRDFTISHQHLEHYRNSGKPEHVRG